MTDEELMKHYGIDKEEHCYGFCVVIDKGILGAAIGEFIRNDAKRQRTIIDYDDECEEFIIRTYPMSYGGKEPELRNESKEPSRTMRTLARGTKLPEGAIRPLP